ncbi:MAG: hypothetical protein JWO72_541 [Caulobacteraceae bacterium]|nr:hypothetical protein [Caulobacteraceae bacterium]
MDRSEQEGRAARPVGQCRAIELEALARVNLGLPVERQVIGVLADHDVGDRRLGGQAALDEPGRRWRLDHDIRAGAAGVLR